MSAPAEILHLKCNETTGTTAYDSSAAANNCTLNTGTLANLTVAGKIGNGLFFDATVGEWLIPASPIVLGTNWSFSCWINLQSLGATRALFGKEIGGSPAVGYAVVLTDGTLQIETDTNDNYVTFALGATTASWIHAVVIKSGTSVTCYKNGAFVSTQTLPTTGSDNLTVNLIAKGFSTNNTWATMDDVRFFADLLTADHVAAIYNGGNGTEDSLATLMPFKPAWAQDVNRCIGLGV